nr:MAG TPA: hypothetical protein [Caudoviricetes sp.]
MRPLFYAPFVFTACAVEYNHMFGLRKHITLIVP